MLLRYCTNIEEAYYSSTRMSDGDSWNDAPRLMPHLEVMGAQAEEYYARRAHGLWHEKSVHCRDSILSAAHLAEHTMGTYLVHTRIWRSWRSVAHFAALIGTDWHSNSKAWCNSCSY